MKSKKLRVVCLTLLFICFLSVNSVYAAESMTVQARENTGIKKIDRVWIEFDTTDGSDKVYISGQSEEKSTEVNMFLYNEENTLTTEATLTENGTFSVGCLPCVGSTFTDGSYTAILYDTTKDGLTSENGMEKGYRIDFRIKDNAVLDSGNAETTDKTDNVEKTDQALIPDEKNESGNPTNSAFSVNLKDIGGHWAEQDIISLEKKKIVSGYKDNTFRPDESVSRAEFSQIVKTAFQVQTREGAVAFRDVRPEDWCFDAISALYENKIVSGTERDRFSPDNEITREQMAVILYKTTQAINMDLAEKREYIPFLDNASISDYAKEAVKAMYRAEIINGVRGSSEDAVSFYPREGATRAEVSVIVNKMLSQSVE